MAKVETNRAFKTILVTGGAGFIGSNLIRAILKDDEFTGRIVNLDALTYAGNLESLSDVEAEFGGRRYFFEKADICDRLAVERIFDEYAIDAVAHLAAESHVDRSILGPESFIKTNVMGTFTLLDAARSAWKDRHDVLFHHVSTDEVFGSLGDTGYFNESTPYDPRSPYSASKASSDHLAMAYYHTYGLPVTLSSCSNNYGPFQFPEKLIPLMILNMLEGKTLPVYGDGRNIRDWVYVTDHCAAVWAIMRRGRIGQSYAVGGDNELENITLISILIRKVAEAADRPVRDFERLIRYVADRPGHDRRYAIDCSKIKRELGWRQEHDFESGLAGTVAWYLANSAWIGNIRNGAYMRWIEANYPGREVERET